MADLQELLEETAGTKAAAFGVREMHGRLREQRERQTVHAQGVVGLITDAQELARRAALVHGSPMAFSRVGDTGWVHDTSLMKFFGDAAGLSTRGLRKAIGGQGQHISMRYGEGVNTGGVYMNYFARTSRPDKSRLLASVFMHDSYPFANVTNTHAPLTGEGNIAGVPGALEALMDDAQMLGHAMIDEYGGIGR